MNCDIYTYIEKEERKTHTNLDFMDGNVVVSPRHSNSASWVDGKMFHSSKIWDEMMECGIYIPIYRKKNPSKFLVFMDGNVAVSQTHIQIELIGWMEKCFIHSQIWDETMECDILRKREGKGEKKKPIQIFGFSWIGNVVVSQIHTQIELLGWMEKCFIHSQIWDEIMECDILRKREGEKKKKPSKFGFHGLEML
jgi:hypothetical protein